MRLKMARRTPYSKVNRHNEIDRTKSKRKGDLLFSIFQCINPNCTSLITLESSEIFENDKIKNNFSFACPNCDYNYHYGGVEKFFEYSMDIKDDSEDEEVTYTTVSSGDFLVKHEVYLAKAKQFKYCVLCSTLQPIENFDNHNSRKSKKQGECNSCKYTYNSIKNMTRTPEQFAESSQKRRLYTELAGTDKIYTKKIFEKYDSKCYNCERDLSDPSKTTAHLDHTLPAKYLWPLNTDNATLLCSECNGNKSDTWPGEFYSEQKLRGLVIKTGIDYTTLKGSPSYNPEAIEKLHQKDVVDKILITYGKHIDEIIKIRNRIFSDTAFDFFTSTNGISEELINKANLKL